MKPYDLFKQFVVSLCSVALVVSCIGESSKSYQSGTMINGMLTQKWSNPKNPKSNTVNSNDLPQPHTGQESEIYINPEIEKSDALYPSLSINVVPEYKVPLIRSMFPYGEDSIITATGNHIYLVNSSKATRIAVKFADLSGAGNGSVAVIQDIAYSKAKDRLYIYASKITREGPFGKPISTAYPSEIVYTYKASILFERAANSEANGTVYTIYNWDPKKLPTDPMLIGAHDYTGAFHSQSKYQADKGKSPSIGSIMTDANGELVTVINQQPLTGGVLSDYCYSNGSRRVDPTCYYFHNGQEWATPTSDQQTSNATLIKNANTNTAPTNKVTGGGIGIIGIIIVILIVCGIIVVGAAWSLYPDLFYNSPMYHDLQGWDDYKLYTIFNMIPTSSNNLKEGTPVFGQFSNGSMNPESNLVLLNYAHEESKTILSFSSGVLAICDNKSCVQQSRPVNPTIDESTYGMVITNEYTHTGAPKGIYYDKIYFDPKTNALYDMDNQVNPLIAHLVLRMGEQVINAIRIQQFLWVLLLTARGSELVRVTIPRWVVPNNDNRGHDDDNQSRTDTFKVTTEVTHIENVPGYRFKFTNDSDSNKPIFVTELFNLKPSFLEFKPRTDDYYEQFFDQPECAVGMPLLANQSCELFVANSLESDKSLVIERGLDTYQIGTMKFEYVGNNANLIENLSVNREFTARFDDYSTFIINLLMPNLEVSGSYSASCMNITSSNNQLSASCLMANNQFRTTTFDTNSCQAYYGEVINKNGILSCDYGDNQPPQIFPSGSYRNSCKEIRWNNGLLQANCLMQDAKTYKENYNFNPSSCMYSVINVDGSLACGDNQEAPDPTVRPTGSYLNSCDRITWQDGKLSAYCNTGGASGYISSSIMANTCGGNKIMNQNGHLACDVPSPLDPLPIGSYRDSCTDITFNNNMLTAKCTMLNGKIATSQLNVLLACPWKDNSMPNIENRDGRLACAS